MNTNCAYCKGTGFVENSEVGDEGGNGSSSFIRCSCQLSPVPLDKDRVVYPQRNRAGMIVRTSVRYWLTRMKVRWQLRGRVGVDINCIIWRGLRLLYHPPNNEKRAMRDALKSIAQQE